jgi:hypothetical protein
VLSVDEYVSEAATGTGALLRCRLRGGGRWLDGRNGGGIGVGVRRSERSSLSGSYECSGCVTVTSSCTSAARGMDSGGGVGVRRGPLTTVPLGPRELRLVAGAGGCDFATGTVT